MNKGGNTMGIGTKAVTRKVKKTVNNATDELLGIEDDKKIKKPGKKKKGGEHKPKKRKKPNR